VIELFAFQFNAASQICDRFMEYTASPVPLARRGRPITRVPFYQALSALTGAGKTAILAESVSQISETMSVAPVVLWLSKGKVVVEQSYANLVDGGKYRHLLGPAQVRPLSEYRPSDVASASNASVYFGTVGTFNQKDKETGNLRIHKSEVDTIGTSAWDALATREDSNGARRPLMVVYDEAQNLSDQQTELLLELEPDGFLLASATLRFPQRFYRDVIEPLTNAGYDEQWLTTSIPSAEVVDSGLVKAKIVLAGYNSPMAETIDDMLADFRDADAAVVESRLDFRPKAIYVANTNQLASDSRIADNPSQPFVDRQAAPILIWRYLTEVCQVPPDQIAVYASLKVDREYPPPASFNLFSGGDRDYEKFTSGPFRHIIFNLALQEGWDDPSVYFAYVDRSMDSPVQITQVIGRVLRQPGAKHYASDRLNAAHFYVRVDENQTFNTVLSEVKKGLGGVAPEIRIVSTTPGQKRVEELLPRHRMTVPKAALDNRRAVDVLNESVLLLPDFSDDSVNTRGDGERRVVTHTVGSDEVIDGGWARAGASSQVSARWVFRREITREFPPAQTTIDTTGAKFDAMVGVGSPAFAQVTKAARESVERYLENVYLNQQRVNPYQVGSVLVDREKMVPFTNSIHEGYDGMNGLEIEFAIALDSLGLPWARNLPRVGYGIPLVTPGATGKFYPDFLLWTSGMVICIDTKGEHLIVGDAARKLLSITARPGTKDTLEVRLISNGTWAKDGQRRSGKGYTIWGLAPGQLLRTQHYDTLTQVVAELSSPIN
jgi:type III restriction enzyme